MKKLIKALCICICICVFILTCATIMALVQYFFGGIVLFVFLFWFAVFVVYLAL